MSTGYPLRLLPARRPGAPAVLLWMVMGLGVLGGAPSEAEEAAPVGKVIAIIGTVEHLTNGAEIVARAKAGEVIPASFEKWETVKFHQLVFARDAFRTSRKSRLKVMFEDKSLMALGPNTTMTVESYLYKPEDRLRQGVINVAHGLSMYIVNKTQTHKNSFFNIVSPTANIAARGTHGYISSNPDNTLVANQAGAVLTRNADPNVSGQQIVGGMEKNMIPRGQPPTGPTPLGQQELQQIRNVVLAPEGLRGIRGEGKPMIEVEEKKAGKEEEKDKEEESKDEETQKAEDQKEGDKEKSAESESEGEEKKVADTEQGGEESEVEESKPGEKTKESKKEGETKKESGSKKAPAKTTEVRAKSEPAKGTQSRPAFGSSPGEIPSGLDIGQKIAEVRVDFLDAFTQSFDLAADFGMPGDFGEIFQPFRDTQAESCSR